jgi:hypothetical protein
MNRGIDLRWLGKAPVRLTGVTWGVSWPQGELAPADGVHLEKERGGKLPTQTWPLAYWPDGSVKWLGMAAVLGPGDGERFVAVKGKGPAPSTPVTVEQLGIEIFKRVDTGVIRADVGDRGVCVLQEVVRGGRTVAGAASLVCRLQTRGKNGAVDSSQTETCLGVITKLTVEQSGPVRAVIRLDGVHRTESGGREWLPFVMRLVFYAGVDTIEMQHTFIYDGRQEQDFIAGLGLRVHVPLLDTVENRHARFAGAGGTWCEPARYHYMNAPASVHEAQVRGERVDPRPDGGLLPVWDSFQLFQDSADHFAVRKRQIGPVCWVDAGHGVRAPGLAGASDPGGGVALGIGNFWQSFPSALQVDGLTGTETSLTAWLWAPEAAPMDMRHYGTRDHRPIYEAVNPDPALYSSPYGIARTSRIVFFALPAGVTHDDFAARGQLLSDAPRLVAAPEHYRRCGVFGAWAPVDRRNAATAAVEDELDAQYDFFSSQVDSRRWYGFWNHGDVMHTYDHERHVWRYDIGGCAWHNAELGTDLWLWYAFLRSGRPDVFRMAEAMTWHVSEVDCYHIGMWKGQGTRHNVVHWGCPCKEPRVSVANPKRFLYYLTADERMGDLLWEVAAADLGKATNVPTDPDVWHARIGPTWASFCANWLAAWERTNDPKWRDRIVAGIEGILRSPYRLLTGTPFTFDPATGAMAYRGDDPYHANRLVSVFGGAETWIELAGLLDHPAFADAVAEYGDAHAATKEECANMPEGLTRTISLRWSVTKLAAYSAARKCNPARARRCWELLLHGDGFGIPGDSLSPRGEFRTAVDPLSGRTIRESNLSTNHDSQWALNAIACLALVPEALTQEMVEKWQTVDKADGKKAAKGKKIS